MEKTLARSRRYLEQIEAESKQQTFIFVIVFDDIMDRKVPVTYHRDPFESYALSYFKFFDENNEVWIDGTFFLRKHPSRSRHTENGPTRPSLHSDFFQFYQEYD